MTRASDDDQAPPAAAPWVLRRSLTAERSQVAAGDDLEERLRAWRDDTARAMCKPSQWVLPDATLAEIIAKRPATSRQLAAIAGMGGPRLPRLGKSILYMIATARAYPVPPHLADLVDAGLTPADAGAAYAATSGPACVQSPDGDHRT